VHVKNLTCSLNNPPVNNLLWSQLTARRDRRVFPIQACMLNTYDLTIVSSNAVGHIRIFTPGFVNLAKQFVLGHALARQASHDGQAQHDTSEAPQMAGLRRGGRRPPASVDPAERRATRDLLRRRMALTRPRAALLPQGPHTHRQYPQPARRQKLADKAKRDGVAARFPEPAVQQHLDVDRARRDSDDQRLRDLELPLVPAGRHHRATPVSVRRTGPALGNRLSLVGRDESPDIRRVPRGPRKRPANAPGAPAHRLVMPTSNGPSATPPGGSCGPSRPASRCWPASSKHRARGQPGPSWRTLGPVRSLPEGNGVRRARSTPSCLSHGAGRVRPTPHGTAGGSAGDQRPAPHCHTASWNAPARVGPYPGSRRRCLDPRASEVGCPSPAPGPHGRTVTVQPLLCEGRDEGTATLRGRRGSPGRGAASAVSLAIAPQDGCGAAMS
jgi:hypothetical protein